MQLRCGHELYWRRLTATDAPGALRAARAAGPPPRAAQRCAWLVGRFRHSLLCSFSNIVQFPGTQHTQCLQAIKRRPLVWLCALLGSGVRQCAPCASRQYFVPQRRDLREIAADAASGMLLQACCKAAVPTSHSSGRLWIYIGGAYSTLSSMQLCETKHGDCSVRTGRSRAET